MKVIAVSHEAIIPKGLVDSVQMLVESRKIL